MINNEETSTLVDNFIGKGYNTLGPSSKKVIYCVHGKPSAGCCEVLEQVVTTPGEFSMTNATKINADATELVNKHCHKVEKDKIDKRARKKLIIASILCLIFMVAEIIGGYLSSSLAIATDAAHLLTDFASFMISLFSLWVATRPATKKMSFGWYRAEVIGALTSVLMIWVVTAVLVDLAVERIINKDFEIDSKIMLITSGFGVAVNIIMGLTLHQHGHSHGAPSTTSKNQHNINVRAAFIHVIGDFIQSAGVFVAALMIYIKPEWKIADPICTFLFSILVLITTFTIIRDALLVLMEGMPHGIDFNDVMNVLLNIDGVKKVHNLRIWALSLDKVALSAHVAIGQGVNPQNILMTATKNIHDEYNFFEMTLQIEEFQEIMDNCNKCQPPQK